MTDTFGSLLRTWRIEQKHSVRMLATRAGIGRSTLSRWENDLAQPGMLELEAVLDALGASSARKAEALRRLHTPRAALRLHEVTDGGEPVAGDLLRAMRTRQGWTQADLARRIGVTQGTIAKWEHGEDWPSTAHLHALCYALNADEAEVTTLTAGRFIFSEQAVGKKPLDALSHEVVSLSCNHDAKGADALADLRFLSLRATLAQRAMESEEARVALAILFSRQGQYLVERARYREVAPLLRLQSALGRDALTEHSRSLRVVVQASTLARAPRFLNPRKAALLLIQEMPLVCHKGLLAWLQGSAGSYLAEAGDGEVGLRLNRLAIETARHDPIPSEARYREGETGQTLARMGRDAEALAVFERLHASGPLRPLADARNALWACEAALHLGQPADGACWLSRANHLIESHALMSLQPDAQHLQQKCLLAG